MQECHVKKGSMLLVFSRETEPIGAIYMREGEVRKGGEIVLRNWNWFILFLRLTSLNSVGHANRLEIQARVVAVLSQNSAGQQVGNLGRVSLWQI